MSSFIVEGSRQLQGSIAVKGNKNEALPAIAAALLSRQSVELSNVPDIGDIRSMLAIAAALGAEVGPLEDNRVIISAPTIEQSTLPLELSSAIRGSILFASALLVRTGQAIIPQPGGDVIGRRRVDTHFLVFQALGAELEIERISRGEQHVQTIYRLTAPKDGLKGGDIYLDEASVTATENALIAACGARGTTVIANAASEPHVQGLCQLLCSMGARIEGIGSNILTVHGSTELGGAHHPIGSDYIEAGSLMGLAAATNSELTITNVDTQHLRMIRFQFERLGILSQLNAEARTIHVPANQPRKIRKDLGATIPRIEDSPWPALPADLTSIFLVTATQCEGTCLIHEKMFESRLFFVDKLIGMGAQIVLCDPHRAVIVGPSRLYASTISSPDIRAGMALLIAALAADGTSKIYNVDQIDRGYQQIDTRLNALGASITRSSNRRRDA
jgi:UDP-N-acetylglucosamine 1-carboxyvinyltransferase